MASFDIAYKTYILPNEGGYANVAADKGGETYAGIARNYNQAWQGWTFIDFEKRKLSGKPIKLNRKFPSIDYLVRDFYLNRWNSIRLTEIVNQEIANLLYDFHVHSQATAIKFIQRIVGVPADGKMGTATITTINKGNAAKIHDALLSERKKLLESLIAKNPSQEIFREGWMARLAKFPTLLSPTTGGAALGVLAVGAIILYVISRSEDFKKLAT